MNILITGGTGGIGIATIEQLAIEQNNLYFTYSNNIALANEIEKKYKNAKAIHCNFNSTESIEKLIAQIETMQLDVLINNAMEQASTKHFHKTNAAEFLNSFETNVLSVIKITQAAILSFRKNKQGKIINILSTHIINKPPVGLAIYVANKNYLLSLSKSWAVENIKYNITSNAISPSFMTTNFTSTIDSRIVEKMQESHVLKKFLTPKEVANTILFLTNCTQHINGVNIIMNAGADIF